MDGTAKGFATIIYWWEKEIRNKYCSVYVGFAEHANEQQQCLVRDIRICFEEICANKYFAVYLCISTAQDLCSSRV